MSKIRMAPYQDGIPEVANDTQRDILFIAPRKGQRVFRADTSNVERWNGAAWDVVSIGQTGLAIIPANDPAEGDAGLWSLGGAYPNIWKDVTTRRVITEVAVSNLTPVPGGSYLPSAVSPNRRLNVLNTNHFSIVGISDVIGPQDFLFTIANLSGGVMGAITWGPTSTFRFVADTPPTNPANGKMRLIEFFYDGTNWVEKWRSAGDLDAS